MNNPFSLIDKTILITGASSGIGRACALICAEAGAKLIITGRNEERLSQTLNALSGEGHKIVIADLINESERQILVDAIDKADGVILNAGINDKSLVKFLKQEFVSNMMQINFTASVMLIQSLLKKKKLSNGCSIVLTSSVSAFYPTISNAIYGASKAALVQFARVLAKEVKTQNIRVNTIAPAMVETQMLQAYTLQDNINELRESNFNGRFIQPEEVAYACQYLLSDAAQMITGTNVVIDGGLTL